MEPAREKIVILECEPESRQNLLAVVQQGGYQAVSSESAADAFEAIRHAGADLLLLNANMAGEDCREVLAELKGSAATQGLRIILLVGNSATERAMALNLGADDVLSRPWDADELLARVRAQLRAKRAEDDLRSKTRIAEEGQQIARTAFEALAVTEKMTRDAFSLDRALKVGVAAVFVIAAVMAGIFFLFSHRANKETQRAYAVIAKLEGGLTRQQDLMAKARKLRAESPALAGAPEDEKQQLQQHAEQIKAQMSSAGSDQVSQLQKDLAETNARLRRVEQAGQAGQSIIRTDVMSVCLLHVTAAFRHIASGQRLRYAGLNPQGEPLQDSDGNPIYTLEGRGPEVHLDVFGTGFLAGPGGLVVTNRHVAQPWWENEDLGSLANQGLQPEIVQIDAYFPDAPRAFPASIQKISSQTDLALMQVDLDDLKRQPLQIDDRKEAAVSGQPVVAIGYATGLAAILARADEATAQDILAKSEGDPKRILDELARRNLIRPLATQGHIGDVLPDKIVFDAQTTSGGSGGPLFNQDGKVVGVTYAVLRGFGGSNFGIPIRYTDSLLSR
jgi:DNA-binding response OmpR family regulator/S1-C subfamily serine protease